MENRQPLFILVFAIQHDEQRSDLKVKEEFAKFVGQEPMRLGFSDVQRDETVFDTIQPHFPYRNTTVKGISKKD